MVAIRASSPRLEWAYEKELRQNPDGKELGGLRMGKDLADSHQLG
jgi:hypothetical protein